MVKSERDSLGLEKRLLSLTLGAVYSLLEKSSKVACGGGRAGIAGQQAGGPE